MKFLIIIAAFFCAHMVSASPTEITPLPSPTPAVANQTRTKLKHRKHPLLYSAIPTTVPNIIALNQQLPVGVKSASVRKREVPISPIENNVYTVDGDLWRVEMEDDNDYHLEISARGATRTADRIVAEIPSDPPYASTRKQLLSILPGNYIFKRNASRTFAQSNSYSGNRLCIL
jgi:hypothetical protein